MSGELERFRLALEVIALPEHRRTPQDIARCALAGAAEPEAARAVEEAPPRASSPVVDHITVPQKVPQKAPAPDTASTPRRLQRRLQLKGPDGLTEAQSRLLALVREAGAISPGEATKQLQLDKSARQRATRELLARGLIVAEGATASAMLKPAPEVGRVRTELHRQPEGTVGKPGPTVEGRVLAAVRYRVGTIRDLAKRLEIGADDVAVAVAKLEAEGEIRSRGTDDGVVWRLA